MPATIAPRPEFAAILREQETFAVAGKAGFGNRLNGWFDRLMLQSGMELAPSSVLGLCLVSAIAFGGSVFVVQENPLTAAGGTLGGGMVPILLAVLLRARRQHLMSRQLPELIDELARAAKTGRSLESCLALVSQDTGQPLGGEFKRCTARMEMGLDVERAMADLPERTGIVGARVLVIALSVHRRTGGDLIQVLERLSQSVRDRLEFQGRLRAATAASRATATLMIVLPLVILAFFVFRDPNYLSRLFSSAWGVRITVMAFVLELVGAMWVIRVLQQSQRV